VLDLEREANHRGSAFGAATEAQPSQQTFENALAAQLLLDPSRALVVEDESRYVGRRLVPDALLEAMRAAPVVVLEVPLATRVQHIYEEYVEAPARAVGVAAARERLEGDTRRIRKRLGGGRTDAVVAALRDAEVAGAWFDRRAHEGWIATLLEHYYDRLYRKAFASHDRPLAFRGDAEAVAAYLAGGAG
jgi:tRNA 2-selenouridine synthase